MQLLAITLLCFSTTTILASNIVKRDNLLIQSLKISPPNVPAYKQQPLEYIPALKIQSPPALNYDAIRNAMPSPFFNTNGPAPTPRLHVKRDVFHPDPYGYNTNDIRSFGHPNNIQHNIPLGHGNDIPYDHNNPLFVDGGIPDFNFEIANGISGPLDGQRVKSFNGIAPLPFGDYGGHRIKTGYSPVHYRYNDGNSYIPNNGGVVIKCNRYHCPL